MIHGAEVSKQNSKIHYIMHTKYLKLCCMSTNVYCPVVLREGTSDVPFRKYQKNGSDPDQWVFYLKTTT